MHSAIVISIPHVYYLGTKEEWSNVAINNNASKFENATIHYYSEVEPPLNEDETSYDDNYWHFDGDVVTPWTKETIE